MATPVPPDRRIHDTLSDTLTGFIATGFATRGMLSQRDSNLDVGLTVKGIGEIKLPLESDNAVWEKLKNKSDLHIQARGEKITSEPKDAKIWEVDAAEVSFAKQPLWDAWLNKAVSTVKKNFGIPDDISVAAKPYQLVVYEQGSRLEPRQDSRKALGSFATLTFSLRSNYQGANVRVSHNDQSKTFNTEDQSWNRYQWLAWCTDAVYEMKPITFGMRLMLTYDLHFTQYPATNLVYNAEDEYAMSENVRRLLSRWTKKPSMLWLLLQHKDQNLLEANDAFRVKVLQAACSSLGYTVYLSQVLKSIKTLRSSGSDSGSDDDKIGSTWGLSAEHFITTDGTEHFNGSILEIVWGEVAKNDTGLLELTAQDHIDFYNGGPMQWHYGSAILIVPPQSLIKLEVRRLAASKEYSTDPGYDSAGNPAIKYLKDLAYQIGTDGKISEALSSKMRQIIDALLSDFKEYQRVADNRDQAKPSINTMYLRLEELETVAMFLLPLGWEDLIQRVFALIVHKPTFRAGAINMLAKNLGSRMYEYGEINPANLLLGLCDKGIDIIGITDAILSDFKKAREEQAIINPRGFFVSEVYWRRFWYREAMIKSPWSPETELQPMAYCARLLRVARVLCSANLESTILDWIDHNARYMFHSFAHVTKFLRRSHTQANAPGVSLRNEMHTSDKRLYNCFPRHGIFYSDLRKTDLLPSYTVFGFELGDDGLAEVESLFKSLANRWDFKDTMAFVLVAVDHKFWHEIISKMLYPYIQRISCSKEKGYAGISDSENRRVSPHPQSKAGPTLTVADIKLLMVTLKKVESVLWAVLEFKMCALKEFDLDQFADIIPQGRLNWMKDRQRDLL